MYRAPYDEDFKKSIVTLFQNGKSQSQLSKEYGVSLSAINKWVRLYSTVKTEDGEILTAKQVKAMQKRLLQLEEENLILKKAIAFLHAGLEKRLNAVHLLRFQHKIKTLCRVLRVNRSTYYKHFSVGESNRAKEDRLIKSHILTLHGKFKKRLGVKKMTCMLKSEYGIKIGTSRVRRLMRSMNLPKIFSKKSPNRSTKSESGDYKNLLNRKFHQSAPNQNWVSDITYIRVGQKWAYLCVIIDLFSRKVIAWKISFKADAELVISTFKKAYVKRNFPKGLMFHSDRGSQYTSKDFRKLLDELDVVQSFSGIGCPYDNAVAESFFKYLKKEEIYRKNYSDFSDLQSSLFEYIDGFYNPKRPHSSNDFLSPDDLEFSYFHHLS